MEGERGNLNEPTRTLVVAAASHVLPLLRLGRSQNSNFKGEFRTVCYLHYFLYSDSEKRLLA